MRTSHDSRTPPAAAIVAAAALAAATLAAPPGAPRESTAPARLAPGLSDARGIAARGAAAPAGIAPRLDVVGGVASDRVILRLARGAETFLAEGVEGNLPEAGAWSIRVGGVAVPAAREAFADASVRRIRPAIRRGAADAALAAARRLDRYVIVEVPAGSDTPSLAARFAQLPGVEHAEADGIGGLAGEIPDDPRFPEQWNLRNVGQTIAGVAGLPGADVAALGAWARTTGGGEVVVAVLDSGVNPHVDLGERLLPGWNVPLDNDVTADVCGSHGTGVASLIGARGDDGIGMAGLDWSVRFLPIVVVNPCSGTESFVAEGLVFAVDAGADIANMSLQYFTGTQLFRDAVGYAHDAGVLMVAATGNGTASTLAFPAQWPETVAVGASNNLDLRWSQSRWGPGISLVAPGQRVLCASGTTTYTTRDGTSFAVPHVSGTASLMLAANPYLDADSIRAILEGTAFDLEAPGYDLFTGFGRLDAAAAVAATPVPGDVDRNGLVDGADLAIVLGSWGACPEGSPCEADVDRNGEVNGADLGLVLGGWTG